MYTSFKIMEVQLPSCLWSLYNSTSTFSNSNNSKQRPHITLKVVSTQPKGREEFVVVMY